MSETTEQRIERAHEDGAKEYGSNWVGANLLAIEALVSAGMRPEAHQKLGTIIAIKICQRTRMLEMQYESELHAARKDTERLDGLLKAGCYLGHMSHRIRDRAHLDELLQDRESQKEPR